MPDHPPLPQPGASGAAMAASPGRSLLWATASFWIVVIGLLPLMVTASHDFGMTWDEPDRHTNGRAILEYFQGKRPREEAHWGTIYPGLFDVIPAWLEEHVSADQLTLRHRVNAVFGWVGIVFAGLLAGRLFGPWSAMLAALLLAASPRYFAHSMNNPKDLPFAAMSVVVLYCLSRLSPRWPHLTARAGAALAVALGLALGTRPGALLYFGYLPLLLVAIVIRPHVGPAGGLRAWSRFPWSAAAELTARVALVLVAGLLLGTVFWPWAQAEPFTRPFEALVSASDYDFDSPVLFGGRSVPASQLPWFYLPAWFLIATPPVVLAGMALSIVAPVRGWGWPRLALWSVALLPIVLIIVRDSTVYDSHRHVLFAYLPMVVLAASGWAAVLASRSRWLRAGALALLIPGVATVVAFHLRSHPHQGAYINELAGGPRGAMGRYELEYWGNCLKEAVDWAAATSRQVDMPLTILASPRHIVWANAQRFPELTLAWSATEPHHLHIQQIRDVEDMARAMTLGDAVYRVTTADGAVLCAVYRGTNYGELSRRMAAGLPPR